jgi:hypothetical protein
VQSTSSSSSSAAEECIIILLKNLLGLVFLHLLDILLLCFLLHWVVLLPLLPPETGWDYGKGDEELEGGRVDRKGRRARTQGGRLLLSPHRPSLRCRRSTCRCRTEGGESSRVCVSGRGSLGLVLPGVGCITAVQCTTPPAHHHSKGLTESIRPNERQSVSHSLRARSFGFLFFFFFDLNE